MKPEVRRAVHDMLTKRGEEAARKFWQEGPDVCIYEDVVSLLEKEMGSLLMYTIPTRDKVKYKKTFRDAARAWFEQEWAKEKR